MEREYILVIAIVSDKYVWQIREGDKILDSMDWKEGIMYIASGAYHRRKNKTLFDLKVK